MRQVEHAAVKRATTRSTCNATMLSDELKKKCCPYYWAFKVFFPTDFPSTENEVNLFFEIVNAMSFATAFARCYLLSDTPFFESNVKYLSCTNDFSFSTVDF